MALAARAVALDAMRLRATLKGLPEGVMRAKGVFRCGDDRLVYQQVGRRSRLTREDGPPPASSALVVIARPGAFRTIDLDALMEACIAAPAGEPAA
ncbi:MAG: hypothetical protein AcusKO_27320 [Acuticoccus sp.]